MSVASLLGDYWITMRPYLFFVSGAAGLTGLALHPSPSPTAQGAAFVALFLSYGLGQALTDVFQIDTDRISSPYRPLVRGTITRAAVVALSTVGLGTVLAVLAWLNTWNAVLVGFAVAGLVAYTWFKRRFWGGPFWNAWIVTMLPIIGFLCGGATPAEALANRSLRAIAVMTFFSYAAFVLLGYFKDIEADRASGYGTLPVRFGRRVSLAVSFLFVLASTAGVAALLSIQPPRGDLAGALAAGWLAMGVIVLIRAHVRMRNVRRDSDAHPAVADSVRGFVVLHAGVAVLLQPALTLPAVAFLVLFEAALAARPERSQI